MIFPILVSSQLIANVIDTHEELFMKHHPFESKYTLNILKFEQYIEYQQKGDNCFLTEPKHIWLSCTIVSNSGINIIGNFCTLLSEKPHRQFPNIVSLPIYWE